MQELRKQCQDFATALLDHTRSSYELEVLLNHDPTGPAFEHGERMHLNRLKLAIKLRQKKVRNFCPLRNLTPLNCEHHAAKIYEFLYIITIRLFLYGTEICHIVGEGKIEECIVQYLYQLIERIVVHNNSLFRDILSTCFGPRRPSSG